MDNITQLIANERVFTLIRRRTRRTLRLQVKPNFTIVVTGPWLTPPHVAIQFVIQHESWIEKQIALLEAKHQKRPIYLFKSGDTLRYLGKHYCLVVQAGGTRATATLSGDQLIVSIQNPTPDRVKAVVTQWYKRRALDIFQDRIDKYAKPIGRTPTRIRLSSALTRWGSCSPTGTICLRWTLIMAPLWVLDYVVIHELCHLVHMNHSPAFWTLVRSIDPDFKKAEIHLKSEGLQYAPMVVSYPHPTP